MISASAPRGTASQPPEKCAMHYGRCGDGRVRINELAAGGGWREPIRGDKAENEQFVDATIAGAIGEAR